MDAQVEALYRKFFSNSTNGMQEKQELKRFFAKLNPPPDKLVWLRATAFRIGSEYLANDHNRDSDVSVLHTINMIVDGLEHTCME